jgi:hypothetical protein
MNDRDINLHETLNLHIHNFHIKVIDLNEIHILRQTQESGSSVSTVTDYELEHLDLIPGRGKRFFS